MATPSLAKLTLWLMYGGGGLIFATICASLIGARHAESVTPATWKRLKRLAGKAYATAALMFAGGFLCSLLVEIAIGRSSQTSRAGGTLTVFEFNARLLFWLTIAFKATAVVFAFGLALKAWKDPWIDQ
ncbi:hypothetical protein [Dyella sp. ASV21]|uniref:hypothetical protein n=1 Tax=Dyella sp. ASV21 TaxID=2795114 RepID=UPI0018EAAE05|nr:hypothetical protein [Dyella sp. ASV21]